MRSFNSKFAVTLVILIALVACGSFAFGKCSTPSQVSLVYSEQAPPSDQTLLLCSPDGKTFVVSFNPWVDVQRHVGELDLVLQPLRKRGSDVNLLIVNRRWHGYQPYTFGAADYVNGAMNSVSGEERIISIPHSQDELVTDVMEVQVEREEPDQLGKIHYRFVKLALHVSMRERGRSPR